MARARASVVQRKASFGKWDAFVQEDRVHRAIYTDPEIFQEEMVKIFGGTWVYLAHESEIPQPNDFKTSTLGTRPIIITRDNNGDLHALLNRCMHRGATVCRQAQGSAKRFMCGYHGWTYDNTGQLVSVPYPKGYGPSFKRAAVRLGEIPSLETYRGLIFGTLNADPPTLHEHLGAARPLIDRWLTQSPVGDFFVRSGAHRMIYRGNWKLAFDNAADGYHPPVSHRSIQDMTTQRYGFGRSLSHFGGDPDEGPMYQQGLGNGHTFCDQRPAMGSSMWQQDRPIPGAEAYEAQLRERFGDKEAERLLEYAVGWGMNLNIFPNLLIIGNQIQVIEPIAVDRTQLTWYSTTTAGVPDEINTLRMRMQEDFPNFGEPDDQTNFEECQRGMNIPELEWINISRGLGTGRQRIDEDGVITGPITSELQLRSYLHVWKQYMSADVTIRGTRAEPPPKRQPSRTTARAPGR